MKALRAALKRELRGCSMQYDVSGPMQFLHQYLFSRRHCYIPSNRPDRGGARVEPQVACFNGPRPGYSDEVAHPQDVFSAHPHVAVQLHLPAIARGELNVLRPPGCQVQPTHRAQACSGYSPQSKVGMSGRETAADLWSQRAAHRSR